MTIIEIAELIGISERGLRKRITDYSKTLAKIPEQRSGINGHLLTAYDKLKNSKKGALADLTLDETISLIRAGGNNKLAELLAENAFLRDAKDDAPEADLKQDVETLKNMMRSLMVSIPELIAKATYQNFRNNVPQLLPEVPESLPEWVRDIHKNAQEKAARKAIARKNEMQLPFQRGK